MSTQHKTTMEMRCWDEGRNIAAVQPGIYESSMADVPVIGNDGYWHLRRPGGGVFRYPTPDASLGSMRPIEPKGTAPPLLRGVRVLAPSPVQPVLARVDLGAELTEPKSAV